jgi:acyl-CoA thioesterase
MKFDALLEQLNTRLTNLSFPANWCQGRTAFGGLSAAMLYVAMKNRIGNERDILSLTTNFVGPLIADEPFDITVEVLCEGKSASQVEARAIQNGKVCVIALGSFAIRRSSNITVHNHAKCLLNPVDDNKLMPYIEGITPAFFQHMNFNIKRGEMPFTASANNELAGWMRLKELPDKLTIAHILALTDAWPPTPLQMYNQPAPASSMSWYIEFLPHQPLEHNAWLAFEAFTHQASDSYAFEEANIYSQAGELVAMSRQTVALFN